MSNRERSGTRDLTISAWHRVQFRTNCSAFDLDLVGMCNSCAAHLYVIEATRALDKRTNWTAQTACRLNCPGFLITYSTLTADTEGMRTAELVDNLDGFMAEQIHPGKRTIGDSGRFVEHLNRIRHAHNTLWHGAR